ncbi:MAG: polysaccharide deacetylase family protein [Patescibacteria group bacterium]|nr:polysaccharide deacetylase family protein [Patescibacteria group bacterium]
MEKKLILTIDLEWYYNGDKDGNGYIREFENMTLEERFKYDNGQIEKSVRTILKTLKKYKQKITFFCLAEIDKVYPRVLKMIYDQGHEIALHSYRHDELKNVKTLEDDLKKCEVFRKKYKILGFRNPRIKALKKQYSSLKKFHYKYDSSVYGTTIFDFSGIKILPVSVFPYKNREVQKIPFSLNTNLFKEGFPFGSGMFVGSLRRLENIFINLFLKRYQKPPCIFLHSWQIEQPFYPKKFILKHPFMVAYCLENKNLLEYFCKNYKLIRVKDYIYE